jgi:hypothetical protein
MDVPPLSDPRWRRALTADEPKLSSLATRFMVTRLRDTVRANPGGLSEAVRELHAFFVSNAFAARDLAAL